MLRLSQESVDDLVIHRWPHAQDANAPVGQAVAILGRHGRAAHEPSFRIRHKIIEEELGRLLHQWIRPGEERAIAAEEVVLPQMLREPCGARWPESRTRQITGRREAPDIRNVMRDEAPGAVVYPRRDSSRLAQRVEEFEERQMGLREIRHLRRPVVHLKVDVQVVVAVPWRVHAVVPEALQVGREPARTAARDQQVTPELKVQRLQSRIDGPLLHAVEPFVCRECGSLVG